VAAMPAAAPVIIPLAMEGRFARIFTSYSTQEEFDAVFRARV
jgi:hypothetical protein